VCSSDLVYTFALDYFAHVNFDFPIAAL
jgi:hypothetical protein